jgi:hypothetical protein
VLLLRPLDTTVFVLTCMSLLCMTGALVITLRVNVPINVDQMTWKNGSTAAKLGCDPRSVATGTHRPDRLGRGRVLLPDRDRAPSPSNLVARVQSGGIPANRNGE